MGDKFTPLDLRDLGDRTFNVLTDFGYFHPEYGWIWTPAGTRTDLTSSPRILWIIVPPIGDYARAAVPHDWLYQNLGKIPGLPQLTRKQCDRIFLDAMKDLGVRWTRRWVMYLGVRAFGWWPWFWHWWKQRPQDPPEGGTPVWNFAIVLAVVILSGCSTTVYFSNGRPQFKTYGDLTGVKFRGPGTSLEIESANHSGPTRAAFAGTTETLTAAGAAVAGAR